MALVANSSHSQATASRNSPLLPLQLLSLHLRWGGNVLVFCLYHLGFIQALYFLRALGVELMKEDATPLGTQFS